MLHLDCYEIYMRMTRTIESSKNKQTQDRNIDYILIG